MSSQWRELEIVEIPILCGQDKMFASDKSSFQGIVLMITAMAAFAVADTLVKVNANILSPPLVMLLLIAGSLLLFAFISVAQRQNLLDRRALAPMMLVRYAAEIVAMIGMVLALTHVPLSVVGAITQATPLLVVFGAVVWFDEKVGWRRGTAIGVGFVGVLLIIQPTADGFDVTVCWAVLATLGLAIRDLVTRLTPHDMRTSNLATYSMLAAMPVAVGWWMLTGKTTTLPDVNWLLVIAMISLGALGYVLLIVSIRQTELSIVTPYRYTRLVFLLGIGVLFFDERPNSLVLLGAGLIVVSGLYTLWRDRALNTDKR